VASAFSHAFVAAALGHTLFEKPRSPRLWALSIVCSILPDADVAGFALGIAYEHPLGHRGFSHSLAFAALLSVGVVFLAFRDANRRRKALLFTHFFLVTASHGFLDALTDGGLGIAFFAPFDNARYFLPWRPIPVSPIRIAAFFSAWGLAVMAAEVLWIWTPAGVVAVLATVCRRLKARGKEPRSPE